MVIVFGLGFVGLTTALGLAEKGYKVYGIDVDEDRLNTLKSGKLPFLEKGLDDALVRHLNKTFFLDVSLEDAINESEYIFYCVGTPYKEDGSADLSYIFTAIDTTLSLINDDNHRILIMKSTIPPSTTSEKIIPYIDKKNKKLNIDIANNPEFLREGFCWDDFMYPDRIVFGVNNERSKKALEKLYSVFDAPMFAVSLNTAEFIKYLSNSTLAALISFANEMSILADTVGDIDTSSAFRIIHKDKRWESGKMSSYLYPGCGYGGYCLPKDTNALNSLANNKGIRLPILDSVIKTNDSMPQVVYERILKVANIDSKIAILGLSFKPDSDDVRSSPSVKIIEMLKKNNYENIVAYDPVANDEFKKWYPKIDIEYFDNLDSIIEIADILVVATAWEEFRSLKEKTDKTIVDIRFLL